MKLVAIKYQPSTRGDLIVKCCTVNLFWLCPFSTSSCTLLAKAVVVGGLRIMPTSPFITAALHIPAASKPQGYHIHYLFQRHVFYIYGWKVIRVPDTTVLYLECNHEKYMSKTKKTSCILLLIDLSYKDQLQFSQGTGTTRKTQIACFQISS